jgi:adenosylcobinamide kinase/adenosylcobinamide-phosphate guanylyltransferase
VNKHKFILILGGVRSGKSAYAQHLAERCNTDVLFVATAEAGDDEMAARIAKHRAERPKHWRTIEAPRAVATALATVEHPITVVLDCVTLWVTNLLLANDVTWEAAKAELAAVIAWYHAHAVEMIVVSNEVGLGIIPGDPLSRTYQDWIGWFNQQLAAEADEVYWMIAGLPVEVKALAPKPRSAV